MRKAYITTKWVTEESTVKVTVDLQKMQIIWGKLSKYKNAIQTLCKTKKLLIDKDKNYIKNY